MPTVPSGTRFIGIATSVDLTERKSALLNKQTEPFSIEDIASTVGVGAQGPQGVQGPAGPLGPVGPAGLEWQGSWVSGTSYVADDAVGYNGASWFCILATSGTTTPNLDATHWALLASQGAQGIQGVQGPTGPQGIGATQTLQQTVDLGNTITDGTNIRIEDGVNSCDLSPGDLSVYNNTYITDLYPGNITFAKQIGNGSIELKIPDTVSVSRTITLPDASGTLALQTYKSYVAKITHSAGNSAPTAVVLENTIGTVTWQYEEEFNYTLVSSGLFTLGKTVIFATSPTFPLMNVGVGTNSANFVGLTTEVDGFANLMIEIRVYA
jgi:hypothetical protein